MNERIVLADSDRKEFFKSVFLGKKYTWKELAIRMNYNLTSLKKIRKGKQTFPLNVFSYLLKLLDSEKQIYFLKNVKFIDSNWGAIKGGKRGILVLRKKYGVEQLRRWRSDAGKKSLSLLNLNNSLNITKPELNEKLSEFIGAYLGDGTLTNYFIRISGDNRFDIPYFTYLQKITKELFGIQASIKILKQNNLNLEIRSKKLCGFLQEEFGLKLGDKIRNKAVIPEKILKEDNLAKACLRGLVDTDGSICRRDKFMCLDFCSHNKFLLEQVFDLGKKFGYFSFKNYKSAGTNSKKKIYKYFSEIGSSNLRHIVRFNEYLLSGACIYKTDTLKYFPNYQNITLPVCGLVV